MTQPHRTLERLAMAAAVLLIPACGGPSSSPPALPSPFSFVAFPTPGTSGGWGWYAGSTINDQSGVYGTQGTPDAANTPGARMAPAYGPDSFGGLWLFGGRSYDSTGAFGKMNDLWWWNGSAWTWVKGSKSHDPVGTYGTKGVGADTNTPGGRDLTAWATDALGRLWVYGGDGKGATTSGELSDLWMLDDGVWTWMAGSNEAGTLSSHGTKGVTAGTNTPGGREQACAWIDGAGHFWVFGGYGSDSTGTLGHLGDLWKFDGTNWTWIAGPSVSEQSGGYGVKGTPAGSNAPGGRSLAKGWTDTSGNLWLFGGMGKDSAGTTSMLNDLWKFDGTNWTWIKGSTFGGQAAVTGTKGTAAAANTPGGRWLHSALKDNAGNFWLICAEQATTGYMNDFWKFDGTNWAWMEGSSSGSQGGTYGVKGTPSASNQPGSRGHAAAWFDASGQLWLFGGEGIDSGGVVLQLLNDLWRYAP